jgi:hypothetical protein
MRLILRAFVTKAMNSMNMVKNERAIDATILMKYLRAYIVAIMIRQKLL